MASEFSQRSFEELMGEVFEDGSDSLLAFNEAADEKERLDELFADTLLTEDPRGPYYLENIDDIKEVVIQGFAYQVNDQRINLTDAETIHPFELAQLRDIALIEMTNLRNIFPVSEPGAPTVVRIANAPFIDTQDTAEDELNIGRIVEGTWLQGEYAGLAPMPVPSLEAYVMGEEGEFETHLTIGIVLENIVAVDTDGSYQFTDIETGPVIVALTMPGTELTRVRYQRDELFETPPDDTLGH